MSGFDSSIARRDLLKCGLGAGALLAMPSAARAVCSVAETLKPTPERAVSLRQLTDAYKSGRGSGMGGLTRLDGYIVDAENKDIVLWGLAEKGKQELYFPDFVVALRSAFGRYIVVKGDTKYRVEPVISLDPNPSIVYDLSKIDVGSASGKGRYREVCAVSMQKVRVEGMPRDCRAAKALIDADYRMKLVAQGTAKLPISSPFPATFDARVASWKKEAEAGGGGAHYTNTRYWFQAGHFSYQVSEAADTVFLEQAQLVLNDEDNINKPDAVVASGKVDPLSRAFSCAWTERMTDTIAAEPVWRDMYNVFRHFAVARVMNDKRAFERAGLPGDFLLDRYELPKISMPDALPGALRIFEYTAGKGNRRYTSTACGGVTVSMTDIQSAVLTPVTLAAAKTVVASRPSPSALGWPVQASLKMILPPPPAAKKLDSEPAPMAPAPAAKPAPSLKDLFKS
jgi:hypothetical protein